MSSERYQRQIILEGFGAAAQDRLAKTKVLIIGAGGLGCPALQYLAATGIGQIGIIDGDSVELSNLHRQILYSVEDIGSLKVDVAARRLKQLNPETALSLHADFINETNVLEILRPYDIIFDGTDNFESRYIINDACVLLNKPLVFAAVSGFEGQIAIFNVSDEAGTSTNYRDIFPAKPQAGEIPNCVENGVLGISPGIIGTIAAGEVLKLAAGIGQPLANKLLHYNLLSQQHYIINITPSSDYKKLRSEAEFIKVYGSQQNLSYQEIDIETMMNLSKKPETLVIDVREAHEFPKLNSAIYRQVPMSQFDEFLSGNVKEENIILLCQHGVRSIAAAEKLIDKYGGMKKIYNLKGGIAKWKKHFLKG
ncbi:HesA/MoeB/ThiF family protein [Pedobacter aquatilis]|uniref:HesA/MoeB/ThiF family protein n=1 Tax=Pedobacter aquatilis TaxID=351343 RepID=UPI00293045FE|nr:HesA/MoeB/ThiF family protein [Pedobacter aquatilis]